MNTTDQPSRSADAKPTVVLVHGAFADGSSWNGVIERLQRQGYTVIAPANPLRGVAADAAAIGDLVRTIDGREPSAAAMLCRSMLNGRVSETLAPSWKLKSSSPFA